jgi:hypothetical protein
MKMKTLTGILAAAISMPALAGPNWDVIHEAEAHHLARHEGEHVVPLDHGPRAITTPYLNKVYEGGLPAAAVVERPGRGRMLAVTTLSRPATAHN